MITPSSAFTAANAALAKQPVFVIEIADYARVFTTKGGTVGNVSGFVSDFAVQAEQNGASSFAAGAGHVVMPNATPAGNILLAFARSDSFSSGGHTISDDAGNTWTPLFLTATTLSGMRASIWRCVSIATSPGNQVHFVTPGSLGSSWFVIEVEPQYSGALTAHTSGVAGSAYAFAPTATTSDGNTLTVPLTNGGANEDLFMVSLAPPGGPVPPTTIGFVVQVNGGPGVSDPSQELLVGAGSHIGSGGGLATAYDWLVSVDDQKLTVSDLEGGANLSDLTFTVQDRGQQLTADLASFVFEGKTARLLHGFVGMAITDFLTMFTGQIDTVDSANGNMEYVFTVSDINIKKLTQKIYLTGDDGFTTSSNHPKTLFDHPLNILVDALEQAGVNATHIDTPKIQYYRDTIFSGTPFKFNLTSAPTAKEFIEGEIMKPLGMYLWVNNLGMVSINSFYPAVSGNGVYTPPTPPVMTAVVSTTASDANQIDVPIAQEAPLVNQVIFKFDSTDSGGDALAEEVVDLDESIEKYGLVGGQTIEAQGMKSGFQGYFQAALVGRLIALRYGFKNLIFDPLPLTWNACTLEPGDIIAVNNPFVPDRVAGVLGISGMFFEVLDRNWRFMDGVIEVKLLAIDFSLFKQYKITPNGEADYAAASSGDKQTLMFQCASTGLYSTGAAANTLG